MENLLTDVRDLAVKDYVRVKYPLPLAALVKEAQVAWRAFWLLPKEIKESVGYQPDAEKSGVGYQGPGRDPKEHFHVRLAERPWLEEQLRRVNHLVVTHFVETAFALLEAMPRFIGTELLKSVEAELEIPQLAERVVAASTLWTLRFLHYLPGCGAHAMLAARHWDKGTGTAHLYESAPGFERFTPEGGWEPVSFGEGETLVIAGLGLQYLSECKVQAMPHQVRASEDTGREGRDSIVLFLDHEAQEYYDKDRWGSTQKLMDKYGPGYFYQMPFSEFSQYFKKRAAA